MIDLRAPAKLYLGALAVAALAATASCLARAGAPGPAHATVAALFVGLLAASERFSLHPAFRTRWTVDLAIVVASVLLFEPGLAMLSVGVGGLLGQILIRRPPDEVVFNASQAALQVGAGSLVLATLGWSRSDPLFGEPEHIPIVLAAAAAIHLVNTASVCTLVGLQSGLSPLAIWRRNAGFDAVEQLSQLTLGVAIVLMVDGHGWALPLLIFPAVAVYRSGDRQVRLLTQTVNAVQALADAVDIRDPYTANHSRRVAGYVRELATHLGLDPGEVDLVERAARVHDIGKMVVDLAVLAKRDKLSEEEWEQLKTHPSVGAEILSRFPEFALATSYVRHHHESVDGRGYPDGLRGGEIPLGARIIAVADSFDAMAGARPYRGGLPMEVVRSELRKGRGTQWDARLVDALLDLVERGRVVAADTGGGIPARVGAAAIEQAPRPTPAEPIQR